MRNRSVLLVLVTLLSGLGLLFVGGAASKAVPFGAASFQSNGDQISGWYWVRSTGRSATYTFSAAPLQAAKSGSVYLNVNALVTKGVSGGSGYSTSIKLNVSNGTRTGVVYLSLVNPFRPTDPDNSSGVGYAAYGHAYVSSIYYRGASTLTFTYTFPTTGHPYHVALNQGAATLAYSGPAT